MRNMIAYVKDMGELTFKEDEFNEIDGLVLSQLVYVEFEKFIKDLEFDSITIKDIKQNKDFVKFCERTYNVASNKKLLTEFIKAKRYKDVKIKWIKSETNEEDMKQFAAMTFDFDDFVFIAYRGTDLDFVGWKEDLYLALEDEIPAQKDAVAYLEEVSKNTNLPIYIGGHSKGGNLSVYSAMKVSSEIKDRIIKVYNYDGPGFKTNIYETQEYKDIENKVFKVLPYDAVVGILLHHVPANAIVKSKNISVFQHDPFNWSLDTDYRLKLAKKGSKTSLIIDKTVKDLVALYDKEEAGKIIDLLYVAMKYENHIDLTSAVANPYRYVMGIIRYYNKLNKEDKEFLTKTFREASKIWHRHFLDHLTIKKTNITARDIRLKSNRLYIRKIMNKDLDDYYEYAKTEGLGEMAGWNHHTSIDETRNIIKKLIKQNTTLAIIYQENNKMIGTISLVNKQVGKLKETELVFDLSKDYWGQGIMSETIEKICQHLFKKTDVNVISASCFVENTQSQRVLEKCGFVYELQEEVAVAVGKKISSKFTLKRK